MSAQRTPRNPWLILGLKLAVGLGLLALVLYSNREEVREVLNGRLRVGPFSLGFLLYFTGLLLAFLRWCILARAAELKMPIFDAFRLGFIGNLFNLVIPGAVGGDVVKAAYFMREQKSRKTRAVASIALDRVIGLLGLFLLALVAGLLGWGRLDGPMRKLVMVVIGLTFGVVVVLSIAFSPALFQILHRRLQSKRKLANLLSELAVMGTAYRSRPAALAGALGLACVTHVLNVFSFYFVSRAMFDALPSISSHFLIVPLVLFSTAIPLPFGALGVSEAISLVLFRLVENESGAVALMGFRVLQYIGCLPSLVVYLANRGSLAEPSQHLTTEEGQQELDVSAAR